MGSTSSAIFTGPSTYSTDFQNVITRAVSIASLPIQQLTSDRTSLTNQSSELGTVDQKVAAIQSALTGIRQALEASFDVSVSDTDILTASTGSGAGEGTYSILVSDAGAYSAMMTKPWAAADGASHTFQLVIGATAYDVTPTDNSAASVAAAINKSYGDKAHATVVNVGPADAPDYRISLQSATLTSDSIDLVDGASLAQTQTAGRPAKYEVNGSGITVSSPTRTVSIADGLTLTIQSGSADPVTVSVTRSQSGLSNALGVFAAAYSNAVAELSAQRGQGSGALNGNPIVATISSVLSGIATYAGYGSSSGLADLGLSLGTDGKLTQNDSALSALMRKNPSGAASLLSDFLDAADKAISGLEDPDSGIVKTAKTSLQSQIDGLTKKIDDKQADVDALEARLQQQMSAADAMIASMQQQYTYMSSVFQAMQTAAGQNK